MSYTEWLRSLQKTAEWVPHMGQRGGMGARNMRTGEIVYGPAARSLLGGGGGTRGAVSSVSDEEKEQSAYGTPSVTARDPLDPQYRGAPGNVSRESGQGRSVEDYLAEQTGGDEPPTVDYAATSRGARDVAAAGHIATGSEWPAEQGEDFPPDEALDEEGEERTFSTLLDLQRGGERTQDILAEAESYGVDVSDLQTEYAKMQESGDTEFAHELEQDAMDRLTEAGFENEINEEGAWVVYEPREHKPGLRDEDIPPDVDEQVDEMALREHDRRQQKAVPPKDGEEVKHRLGYPNDPSGITIYVRPFTDGPMRAPKESEEYYSYPEGSDRMKDSATDDTIRGTAPKGWAEKSFDERLDVISKKLKEPGPEGPAAKLSDKESEDRRRRTALGEARGGVEDIGHAAIGAGSPTTVSGAGAQQAAHQALSAVGGSRPLDAFQSKQGPLGAVAGAVMKPIEAVGNAANQLAGTGQNASMANEQKGPQRHPPDCNCDECREQVIEDDDLLSKPGPGHNHNKKFERLLSHVKQNYKDNPGKYGWAESGDEAAHRIAYSKLGKFWDNYNGRCPGCFEIMKFIDNPPLYFEVMQKVLDTGVIHEGALSHQDFHMFQQELNFLKQGA